MATKGRFDSLDVQAMVAHLQHTLCGRRIANLYDGLTGDTFILKLDGGSGNGNDDDKFLLLESGVRFHTIAHFSAESTMPSPTVVSAPIAIRSSSNCTPRAI
jgi:predicted ribosome quality control (RQC) complex YloA/Tae2 family protein